LISCKKSNYLDAVPDNSLVIPKNLDDLQALLDNSNAMVGEGGGVVPALGEAAADDYYVISNFFIDNPLPLYRAAYIWNDDLYDDFQVFPKDWGTCYKTIFYANVVLDGVSMITPSTTETASYNNIKGSALFYRSHMFFHLAQIFAPQYDKLTANSDWGIILKLKSDINEPLKRSTVKETYDKIISDLEESLPLLPQIPLNIYRPSQAAAHALLARVYLVMQDYDKALIHSDACLNIKSTLLDYNPPGIPQPTRSWPLPLPQTNPEIILYAKMLEEPILNINYYAARIDTNLLALYDANDIRKTVFFRNAAPVFGIPGDNGFYFKGSYLRSEDQFAGLATDEVYLIRSECHARRNEVTEAMNDLNMLIKKRWKNTVTYIPYTATNSADALNKILIERRKELVMRGLRWMDLRRLNKEGAGIAIRKVYNTQLYTLQPNSLHYTFLIPPEVMQFNPAMPQNSR
jgi:tetratricopeptide (TPR) repeat protein